MNILILGAGTQGTLYGVRLARAGHAVTLIARGQRAAELRSRGAAIRNEVSSQSDVVHLPVLETVDRDLQADYCLVTVRREQIDEVLPSLAAAQGIARIVFMVNHAHGSDALFAALGRSRVVLGFPGAAGGIENGVDRYVEVAEQPTVIEAGAPQVAAILRGAGFKVALVNDMDSWLRRHAVFVTAMCGALYKMECDAARLSADTGMVRAFILAVREGWALLDQRRIAPAPLALRAIFLWVPLPFAIRYWRSLLASPRGEYYFARHARHAPQEMSALAADLRAWGLGATTPNLQQLCTAIDHAAQST